ncbi:MAG: cyclin-dependent kinase inhibitor 3 family protein [Alphaproteobacteria bacterium]|nr:cyclin-dependent kinase inhibitor 3 family protein [Alphaproteobacteria bacterium]
MEARTSISDPLRIAQVSPGEGFGRVGITFCPGKHQRDALTGCWARNLDLDLDAIRAWGACAVVTLVEDEELRCLKVPNLGEEVTRRGMLWFHLPIADREIPDRSFESAWRRSGADLRSLLRAGSDVVVHCKGGLGRAGTIAARLLIELGMEPEMAVSEVRKARQDAIETMGQMAYVLGLGPVSDAGVTRA